MKSEILRVETISQLRELVPDGSTVFFDIDETLIIPKTNFIYGHPKFDEFMSSLELTVDGKNLDERKIEMERIYYDSPSMIVEDSTLEIFNDLKKSCKLYGITSRDYSDLTSKSMISQLQDFGFQFSNHLNEYVSGMTYFKNGIIFAAFQDKGQLIKEFYQKNGESLPDIIVFIDDTLAKCQDVATCLDGVCNQIVLHYVGWHKHIDTEGIHQQYRDLMEK